MGLFGSKTPTGKIDELVAEAKAIADELEGYNLPRARMLTAEAYLDEAIRNARTERENVETLLAEVLAHPDLWAVPHGFFVAARRGIREGRYTRPPTRNLGEAFGPTPEWAGELASLRATPLEAVAAAVLWQVEEDATVFGPVEDADQLEERCVELRERFDAIGREVGARWRDVAVAADIDERSSRATLAWGGTNGELPIFPLATLVRRRLDWLDAQREPRPKAEEPTTTASLSDGFAPGVRVFDAFAAAGGREDR